MAYNGDDELLITDLSSRGMDKAFHLYGRRCDREHVVGQERRVRDSARMHQLAEDESTLSMDRIVHNLPTFDMGIAVNPRCSNIPASFEARSSTYIQQTRKQTDTIQSFELRAWLHELQGSYGGTAQTKMLDRYQYIELRLRRFKDVDFRNSYRMI
jgi:hypothetical protein